MNMDVLTLRQVSQTHRVTPELWNNSYKGVFAIVLFWSSKREDYMDDTVGKALLQFFQETFSFKEL